MRIYTRYTLLSLACVAILVLASCGGEGNAGGSSSGSSSGGGATSQSGSTAAMLTYQNALYILDGDVFKVYDISSDEKTTLAMEDNESGAETLFVYENHLFIGGQTGVSIWNIDKPLEPESVSFYPHVRSCDPIIVQADVGYITLRSRPECRGEINRLEIVDFTDLTAPVEIARFPMDFPYGLAKTDDYLAICQEGYGLALVDVDLTRGKGSISADVEEVARYEEINCFDLIHNDGRLVVTALDGIHQLQIDGIVLTQLSRIPVGDE